MDGLSSAVRDQTNACLAVYREDPLRVEGDAAIEVTTAEGGYGRKQVYELIQNGADALIAQPGRITVVLTPSCLYVANEGAPLTKAGVEALMASHLSRKRGEEIGRFGLGFKSITAITDNPQILSRSGSLGFDRAVSTAKISEIVPDSPRYPMLRLAEPLDPSVIAEADDVAAELMTWAATVVRLPLKHGAEPISEDLAGFPSEFVLFSPHVHELLIDDRCSNERRVISLDDNGDGLLTLAEGKSRTAWRVVKATHTPSNDAAADAGELAHRTRISLQWAVPMQNRSRVGKFWAFFPTQSQTTLSGIVNAPWKVSDDRRNLLEGAFNEELLSQVLPDAILGAFESLVDQNDPAAVLDLLPARGREARSWADEVINRPIFTRLSQGRCLPDLSGALQRPADLRIHPEGLDQEWRDDWLAVGAGLSGWVHHGVDKSPERRLKAERLLGSQDVRLPDVTTWIESLCEDRTVEASAAAVVLVARIVRESHSKDIRDAAMRAKVLLLEDGRLVAPRKGTVFVRNAPEESGYEFIHADLAALPGAVRALESLGIHVLDRSGELRNALAVADPRHISWDRVWQLTRGLPVELAADILRESLAPPLELSLRMRCADGRWRAPAEAFLGGGVVPGDGSRDQAFLIDPRFHHVDYELLEELGAVSQPVNRHTAPSESWLEAYKQTITEDFVKRATGSKPSLERLVATGPLPPWPLETLSRLSPEGAAAVTERVLTLDAGEKWTVRHQTMASYGQKGYKSPVIWWLRRHGKLRTAFGPWDVRECLAPAEGLPEDVLPVPDISADWAGRLELVSEPSDLNGETWDRMLAAAANWQDDTRRYLLYAWAVHFVEAPTTVVVTVGNRRQAVPPRDVAAVSEPELFRSLNEQHQPVVLVDDPADAQALIDRWGMAEGARLLQQELIIEPVGEPELLVDRFPALRLHFDDVSLMSLELQRCSAIELVTATPRGQVSRPVPGALEGGRVNVTADDPKGTLQQISNALKLDLTPSDIRGILDQQRQQEAQELVAKIRAAEDFEARIATAVGTEALRRALPATALEAIEAEQGRPLQDRELAALAHAVHGVGVLHHFRSVLDERGLNPPVQWAGLSSARRFVTELGFGREYAGFAADRRPAVFDVDGPADLPPLHDYQEAVTERVKAMLRGEGPARGMVSLPTGAGKTRVAVQALVEELRDGELQGPFVWIAQSDELCEQAVQTWAYVWRAIGPNARMTISRFWATNDVQEDPENFQLVVATPDKLVNAVGKEEYGWLTNASLVLIDEAHSSVAPSYTAVLEWLGRGRSRAQRRLLIGLTATPFRNTNAEETERLAGRYDRNRLDHGAFQQDPYAELQHRGVLARVRHQVLEGADVHLSAGDRAEIDRFKRLPRTIESQLGENHERNRRIVASVAALPEDWPVLLFATSVDNARALAAQLTFRGVPSVAISADTDPAARRHYISEFQKGSLRVITNYNVLAQGFDAPAVRAVYVTRPTFSTNLYQQMIGRGLRGPLNGGSEEVLIVNVRDNLQQYGDQLAFYDFEHLWAP